MPDILLRTLCATLDHLNAGFIASFPNGKILHANRSARDMLQERWPISELNGFVQGKDRKRTHVLMRALREVSREASKFGSQDVRVDICLAPRDSEERVAIGTLKPLSVPSNGAGSDCIIALFVTRIGSSDRLILSGIAECFELTPAEIRTLEQFVLGKTVAEAASALLVSPNTVKTHLQNIFVKTNSSRQPELIKLVKELLSPLRATAPFEESAQLASTPKQQDCRQNDESAVIARI